MRRFRRFLLLGLPLWLIAVAPGCATGLPRGEPDELLAEGKKRYAEKRYRSATRYFRSVDVRTPESDEAEEALVLLAECRRHRGQAAIGFETYKRFIDTFPNSRYALVAANGEYELGRAHLDGEITGFLFFGADRQSGVRVLEHMQVNFRNHSRADDALMRVAQYHLKEEDFEDAATILRRLLAEYPRSEHMLWARFQLARSLWLQNQGPPYDERLLINSRRAFEDYIGTARLENMADRQARQIKIAARMIRRIDERRAQKEYEIGRFYERTKHPEAAIYYYRHCIVTYPRTKPAKVCQERLDELGAKKG